MLGVLGQTIPDEHADRAAGRGDRVRTTGRGTTAWASGSAAVAAARVAGATGDFNADGNVDQTTSRAWAQAVAGDYRAQRGDRPGSTATNGSDDVARWAQCGGRGARSAGRGDARWVARFRPGPRQARSGVEQRDCGRWSIQRRRSGVTLRARAVVRAADDGAGVLKTVNLDARRRRRTAGTSPSGASQHRAARSRWWAPRVDPHARLAAEHDVAPGASRNSRRVGQAGQASSGAGGWSCAWMPGSSARIGGCGLGRGEQTEASMACSAGDGGGGVQHAGGSQWVASRAGGSPHYAGSTPG